jgi:hypothetical protein
MRHFAKERLAGSFLCSSLDVFHLWNRMHPVLRDTICDRLTCGRANSAGSDPVLTRALEQDFHVSVFRLILSSTVRLTYGRQGSRPILTYGSQPLLILLDRSILLSRIGPETHALNVIGSIVRNAAGNPISGWLKHRLFGMSSSGRHIVRRPTVSLAAVQATSAGVDRSSRNLIFLADRNMSHKTNVAVLSSLIRALGEIAIARILISHSSGGAGM